MVTLRFASGTIEVRGMEEGGSAALPAGCRWDPRAGCHRAEAVDYASVVLALRRAGIGYEDGARGYEKLEAPLRARHAPRPYQSQALEAWRNASSRGVVVLPTGAGKTHLALMAADQCRRSTLVVAPTLDLVRQWYDLLRTSFDAAVGIVGGGEHEVQPLTVTTYDSAWMHMEHLGRRFGLVVFDECHHLPGESYALAARFCLAPFRLGLTATPERTDGGEDQLARLVGPTVFRRDIGDLSGEFLADYDVERIEVELSGDERQAHDEARAIYRGFVERHGIRMGARDGWQRFLQKAATSTEGWRALQAYRRQRQLAFAASAKLEYLELLLHRHRGDRAILFTQDNATAYAISRRFLLPAITHQTKVSERSKVLQGLSDGTFRAVVTSKVLNEGVDVPEANVAIVVSGSGSVREHVQRLGRVLRKRDGKRAVLYELVTVGTTEAFTSERRRDHVAYR